MLLIRLPPHNRLYQLQTSVVKDPNSKLALAKRALATSTVKPLPLYFWHRRLGHLNTASIQTLSKMLDNVKITESDIYSGAEDYNLCIACLEGKQSQTYNKKLSLRIIRLLKLLYSDSCGPFETLSIMKYKYFIIFVDDDTHYVWVFFLRTKSSEEILQVFRQFKALVEKSTGLSIARFRCDNGKGEYDNHQFKYFLAESGISFEPSAPYNQDQNGVSERMIRTIIEKARTMLHDAGLPYCFWDEAVRTAVYLINRSPSKALPSSLTPYEAWYKRKPPMIHLGPFGCDAYVYVHPDRRTTLQPKVSHCTLLGYDDNTTTQYRV